MGRGRQKAKQQKIARKLKYMTTDTDYDELAKELGAHAPGTGSFDPFADVENDEFEAQDVDETVDDLDEYAKWAAEAAAKATTGEMPVTHAQPKPKPHKPIPMPVPETFKHTDQQE